MPFSELASPAAAGNVLTRGCLAGCGKRQAGDAAQKRSTLQLSNVNYMEIRQREAKGPSGIGPLVNITLVLNEAVDKAFRL